MLDRWATLLCSALTVLQGVHRGNQRKRFLQEFLSSQMKPQTHYSYRDSLSYGNFSARCVVACSACVESFPNHIGTTLGADPYFMALVGVDVESITHVALLFLRVGIVRISES